LALPYHIQVLRRDEDYLLTCQDIPEARRDSILDWAWRTLANIEDAERLSPEARLPGEGSRFYHHTIFLADGRMKALRLVVDDSRAEAGVLRIVYAEVVEGKPLRR
jgi:hypothetical protein